MKKMEGKAFTMLLLSIAALMVLNSVSPTSALLSAQCNLCNTGENAPRIKVTLTVSI